MELILYKRVIYFDYAVALYVCVFMCHRHFDARLLLLAPENYALFFSIIQYVPEWDGEREWECAKLLLVGFVVVVAFQMKSLSACTAMNGFIWVRCSMVMVWTYWIDCVIVVNIEWKLKSPNVQTEWNVLSRIVQVKATASASVAQVWVFDSLHFYWFASWRKSIWTKVLYGHAVVFPFHLCWCEVFFAFGFEFTFIVAPGVVDGNLVINDVAIEALLLLFFVAVIAWILFHFLVNVDNMHDIDDALCSFCRHSFWPNRKHCITAEKSVGITNMQIQMSYVYTGFCMHKPHTFFPILVIFGLHSIPYKSLLNESICMSLIH